MNAKAPLRNTASHVEPAIRAGAAGSCQSILGKSSRPRREEGRWRAEAEAWREQYLLNRSFRQAITESWMWQLFAPLRALGRLLGASGFDATNLIPWIQLERDEQGEPNTWIATGHRSSFMLPCYLPRGSLQLRISMTANVHGCFEIFGCGGDGIADMELLFRTTTGSELMVDELISIPRPFLGLKIQPLGKAGRFQIKQLDGSPSRRTQVKCEGVHGVPLRKRQDGCQANVATEQQSAGPLSPPINRVLLSRCEREYPDLCLADAAQVDWSIIIPTIDDVDRIEKCITSCRRHLEPGITAEFLVVDDGTQDPAILEGLRRKSAEHGFRFLQNHQNLGFSATVNHGMHLAQGRFIAICNNDISFCRPCLGVLAETFARQPEIGIVGCRLLYPSGRIQHAGIDKAPGQLRWTHTFHDYPANYPSASRGRYVWAVTGALCAFRRATLQRLGGLSTAYAMAHEDLDYCLYAWTRGIRVYYCAEAVAIHEESATLGRTNSQRKTLPLLWRERRRAGRRYFTQKWRALQTMEHFEDLLPAAGVHGAKA
jgi:GT2 family glycosyltransferase